MVVTVVCVPLLGQEESFEQISPYAFVPSDIGGFFTFDIQRFLKMKTVGQASTVWSELFNEFTKDFSTRELADIGGIDFIQTIETVTFVFFESMDSRPDEFAAIFKLPGEREDLIKSIASLDTIERIPAFTAYEDIPLLQTDPEIDDPPVYLAFPGHGRIVFGYKHEVKKILAIYRGERSNLLARKDLVFLARPSNTAPIFQGVILVSDGMLSSLKEMELPLDLGGATAISLTLDPQSLALRLLIPDPVENTRIASYWKGLKIMLSAMNPKDDREKILFELSDLLDIESSPSQLTLSFPTDRTIPVFEKIIAKELHMRWDTDKAAVTMDNIKIVADALEVYLLSHSFLPPCRSLQELKTAVPAIFANREYELPEKDGWGNGLFFTCDGSSYSIASGGSDQRFDGWDQQAGDYSARAPEDFKMDYIFKNGTFTVGPVVQ